MARRWILADELMRKLGGDSLEEQMPTVCIFATESVGGPGDGHETWRFEYET